MQITREIYNRVCNLWRLMDSTPPKTSWLRSNLRILKHLHLNLGHKQAFLPKVGPDYFPLQDFSDIHISHNLDSIIHRTQWEKDVILSPQFIFSSVQSISSPNDWHEESPLSVEETPIATCRYMTCPVLQLKNHIVITHRSHNIVFTLI